MTDFEHALKVLKIDPEVFDSIVSNKEARDSIVECLRYCEGNVESLWFVSDAILGHLTHGDADDEEGQWITVKGSHIHLNEEGQPDKGNKNAVKAIENVIPSKSTYKSLIEQAEKDISSNYGEYVSNLGDARDEYLKLSSRAKKGPKTIGKMNEVYSRISSLDARRKLALWKEKNYTVDTNVSSGDSSVLKGEYARFSDDELNSDDFYKKAAEKTNPHYNDSTQGDGFGYSDNCQRCVIAYEAQRRGYDVSALPHLGDEDDFSGDFLSAFDGTEIIEVGGSGIHSWNNIGAVMDTWPVGARAMVIMSYRNNKYGHAFVVESTKNGIRYIDPQTGLVGGENEKYDVLDNADIPIGKEGVSLIRIDNLDFTENCKKAFR